MYSNSDYGLLRLILEKAAGGDLGGYMKRRMFDPLRMDATRLDDDLAAVVPHRAPLYAPSGDGYRHSIEVKTSPGARYVIATTACDLTRWAEAHADPASEVSRAITRLMDGATPVPGLVGHYAFGQTVAEVNQTRVVRHEGVIGCNYLTRIPDLGYAIITFTNGYYEPEQNQAIVRFLLNADDGASRVRFPTEPVTVTAKELNRYVGRYVSTNIQSWESNTTSRQLANVAASEGRLEVRFRGERLAVVPVGAGKFSWHGDFFGMLFEFDSTAEDGRVRMVVSYDDGTPPETYVRLKDWTPSAKSLQRLAGTYHSAHLDYSWKVMIDEAGALVIRAPTVADMKVEPYEENEFLVRHEKYPGMPARYWMRFHEDEKGQVTHLTVWTPRLMHHRFDRR
jgi:hypothetical protein